MKEHEDNRFGQSFREGLLVFSVNVSVIHHVDVHMPQSLK